MRLVLQHLYTTYIPTSVKLFWGLLSGVDFFLTRSLFLVLKLHCRREREKCEEWWVSPPRTNSLRSLGSLTPQFLFTSATCCHSSGQPLHFWDTSFCTRSSSNRHTCGCSFTLNSHFFLYDPRTVMLAKSGIGKGYGGRMRVDRGTQSFLHIKRVDSVVQFQQQSCNQ